MSEQPGSIPCTPQILAILNASPESFSGGALDGSSRVPDVIQTAVAAGADILEVGGQSLRTDMKELSSGEEARRVRTVLDVIQDAFAASIPVSVDTYRSSVVLGLDHRCITMINDPSGGVDQNLDLYCIERRLDLVMTYNIARPKVRLSSSLYAADPPNDCIRHLGRRMQSFVNAGGDLSQVIIDPGIDLGKSPQQSLEILRQVARIRRVLGGVRVLWALSRKDFLGALTLRRPPERDAATLAALSVVDLQLGDIVRVHNVPAARDFFLVRQAMSDANVVVDELDASLRYRL